MKIPSAKYLKVKAGNRLASGRDPQKVVLTYAGISAALSFLVTAVRYALAHQISQTGGLQNIGMRSILSTADNTLPILQTVLIMCLDLGYIAAMLRISRRQYASPMTLKAGVERFWPLLRSKLLMGLIYAGIAFASSYLALGIFLFSPFSRNFSELVMPLVADGSFSPELLLGNNELMNSLFGALSPMMIIYALILIPLLLTFSYRYRMVSYVLVDQPQNGALFAMRQSRILMHGNKAALFKVDLSFWWYYLVQFLAAALLYVDVLLAPFGITKNIPESVTFFGTTVIYLAANFAITYFLRNKIEVTFALAYTSLVPKEKSDGVVLGNIFNM